MADATAVPTMLELASNNASLDNIQDEAKHKLYAYDGEQYPTDGCAITLSVLLQHAGIDFPDIYGAFQIGNQLKGRAWQVVPVGQQQPGDVGSTCINVPAHGQDHVYFVLEVHGPDEMLIADNQQPEPHLRYASGNGKTETRFFLRAT